MCNHETYIPKREATGVSQHLVQLYECMLGKTFAIHIKLSELNCGCVRVHYRDGGMWAPGQKSLLLVNNDEYTK